MTSQRLLTMMDPLGHLMTPRRVMAGAARAIVWAASARTAGWIAAELASVGVEALRATSFRHVDASLRAEAGPGCALAVIDFAAVSASDLAILTTLRWTGFRGPIVAVAPPGAVAAETCAIVRIAAVVAPGGPLAAEVARALHRPDDDDD
jgi:hypothetical protein